ncbi:hypothetical protein TWF132_012108 [Orbilia oligospora]|nr:hypothetical protein TWF132_012108 [Orbilia oligospora]
MDVLRSSFRSTAASPEPLTKSPNLQKIPRCCQTEQFYPFCLVQAKKAAASKLKLGRVRTVRRPNTCMEDPASHDTLWTFREGKEKKKKKKNFSSKHFLVR